MGLGFNHHLRVGQIGEGLIASWLKRRGKSVLPIYEKENNDHKGPRLFTPHQNLIAPDMLVIDEKNVCWIEAKTKTAFTWHRMSQQWVTGIDLNHYRDYCEIAHRYPYEFWLLFLHRGGQAKDSEASPAGLFGNSLKKLQRCENHRHMNHGRSGMVYWAITNLVKLAGLEEFDIFGSAE